MTLPNRIAVIGLGYVGLPLAIALAHHFDVVGIDRKAARVAALKGGRDDTREVSDDALRSTRAQLSDDPAAMDGADLFIAVHADSFPRRNVRGATVYTLRERVHDALARSMKRRRSAVPHDGIEMGAIKEIEGDTDTLDRILRDLEKRESGSTKARNSMFAQSVIDRMGETTMMKDDPHREAAFRVLKTAQVPSVLIELAYVTNKADAQLLRSEEWKKKVATSITRAVHHYFRLSQLPL